jgi:hypothetical protein
MFFFKFGKKFGEERVKSFCTAVVRFVSLAVAIGRQQFVPTLHIGTHFGTTDLCTILFSICEFCKNGAGKGGIWLWAFMQ